MVVAQLLGTHYSLARADVDDGMMLMNTGMRSMKRVRLMAG